jgi:predicted acetyltransferase
MLTSLANSQFEVRAATEGDLNALVAFNERIFRPSVGVWTRSLLTGERPDTSFRNFLVLEDRSTARIVASLCMLLQEWNYADVSIPVSQMEIVGTDPTFRGRGLMRMQAERLAQMERAERCLLSCVQGLPGLYQKFGYEYAIPLKGGIRISLEKVARSESLRVDQPGRGLSFRRAVSVDYPSLLPFYEDTTRTLLVRSRRTAALWEYQDTQPSGSEHAIETYVLEQDAQIAGYFRLRPSSKLNAIVLREVQAQTWDGWGTALTAACEAATTSDFNSVLLQMPRSNPLYEAVWHAGGDEIPPFAWQVKVLDWPAFLNRVAPALEARMKASLFANWTGSLSVRLRDADTIHLCFDKGKLNVRADGPEDLSDSVDATVGMFTQLVFGYRSTEELLRWHPDFRVASCIHFALDTLFPKRPSYVYETY